MLRGQKTKLENAIDSTEIGNRKRQLAWHLSATVGTSAAAASYYKAAASYYKAAARLVEEI